jgi:hypothetical protein
LTLDRESRVFRGWLQEDSISYYKKEASSTLAFSYTILHTHPSIPPAKEGFVCAGNDLEETLREKILEVLAGEFLFYIFPVFRLSSPR